MTERELTLLAEQDRIEYEVGVMVRPTRIECNHTNECRRRSRNPTKIIIPAPIIHHQLPDEP